MAINAEYLYDHRDTLEPNNQTRRIDMDEKKYTEQEFRSKLIEVLCKCGCRITWHENRMFATYVPGECVPVDTGITND